MAQQTPVPLAAQGSFPLWHVHSPVHQLSCTERTHRDSSHAVGKNACASRSRPLPPAFSLLSFSCLHGFYRFFTSERGLSFTTLWCGLHPHWQVISRKSLSLSRSCRAGRAAMDEQMEPMPLSASTASLSGATPDQRLEAALREASVSQGEPAGPGGGRGRLPWRTPTDMLNTQTSVGPVSGGKGPSASRGAGRSVPASKAQTSHMGAGHLEI